MRILHVVNEARGALVGRRLGWKGLHLTVASFTFEDLVHFRRAPEQDPVVRREALDRAVAECEGYDGVFAEAPEAVLLHYVRTRRGLRPLRWLVNVVQVLDRVEPLRALIRRAYGEDPLALAAASPLVRWYVTTRAHAGRLVEAGLPAERIDFHPATSASQICLLPTAAEAFAEVAPLPPALRAVQGGVLVAGINSRDLVTLAGAAELARLEVHVLTDLQRLPPVTSRWLAYHDLVPLRDFVSAVAHARVLALPLRAGEWSCGQQTLAIAQHLRTLVVASDVPAVRDYVVDGVSGLLVPPGDPAALAAALRQALDHPGREALVEAGARRNGRDGEIFEGIFADAFAAPAPAPGLAGALPGRPGSR